MLEEITKQLWEAAQSRSVCRISLSKEPFPRLVHPYGICTTSMNKIMLVCKQTTGFTKAGREAGYRNLKLERIVDVEITEENFQVSDDFNPQDSQYKDWVFHVLQE